MPGADLRSEIEAYMNQSDDDAARGLEERRRNRNRANVCLVFESKITTRLGLSFLFDDRVQEIILHQPLLSSELPKQEPDRVYGLQAT
ncbi:hypothetical protein N7G274_004841 [Stereocaulon virgatum]|uniref:Uncharacterized protein n=1 Tax=Stereocaulon virgatum TaxID=373712 RepID=A0ABR4A8Z1_9LECA